MRTITQDRRAASVVTMLALLGAAACTDTTSPRAVRTESNGGLSLNEVGGPGVGVWVCKVSTVPGTYTFNATASNAEGTLAASPISVDVLTANSDPATYCEQVWAPGADPLGPSTDVTVSEIVPAGFQVDSILVVTTPPGNRDWFIGVSSKTVTASYSQGYLVKFFNSQTPPPPAGKGCTPGYWKVQQHWDSWPSGYAPSQSIGTYFPSAAGLTLNGKAMSNYTLVQGLAFQGGSDLAGGAQILLRAGIAGLLNSASGFGSSYPMTTSQLLTAVNNALASGDRAAMIALAARIDAYNNAGCPLN